MSIFGSIMGAIFGHDSAQASASPTAAPSVAPAQPVDVAAIVDKAAASKGEKLAWRTSIVDLMKALGLDSSLTARKQLATELKYTGDANDRHEYLVAQTGDDQACRERRQIARRRQVVIAHHR